ncbi:MAG TPA: dihydrolipoamide acetyltransferase family protein [Micromonospora sp.]|jgi:2-oxoisovalerate dehydrogenase E2 component (dihydrolipoyl transacylase)
MSHIKEFPLPDLGEGLTEGEILTWLVKVGDTVELNQPLVEVETAKAAVEIPSKWAGRVHAIYHGEGTVVAVGTPIIAIDTAPAGAASSPAGPEPAPASSASTDRPTATEVASERDPVLVGYGPRTTAVRRRPRKATSAAPTASPTSNAPSAGAPTTGIPSPSPRPAAVPPQRSGERVPVLAKPPVRKLAKDLGIDLATVTGTGPHGSITRDDVQQAAAGTPVSSAASAPRDANREQRIPVRGVRKVTAENMVASAFTAPHATTFLTIDVTRGMRALDRLRKLPEWHGVRVTPLLLVAKAVLLAIRRHPMINSTWAGDEIIVKDYVNLGIAVATDRGLLVPNIKDAGRLTLRELAEQITEVVQTARAGRTTAADMAGGTFTITNVGVFGIDTGTPILPPGQAGILALGAIREMPWVHRGKIRPRQVTTLGLSFDHRIVDGELGAKFLRDVGTVLSDPEVALLGWT